jgi:hypothetical protein
MIIRYRAPFQIFFIESNRFNSVVIFQLAIISQIAQNPQIIPIPILMPMLFEKITIEKAKIEKGLL